MLFIYAALFVLAIVWLFKRNKSHSKRVPGPTGLPYFGQGLQYDSSNLIEKFTELTKKYGDIFVIKLFGIDYLILNSEKSIKEVITGKELKIYTNDRGHSFWGEHVYWGGQSVAFYPQGYSHVHSKMKKYFVKGLHYYGEDGRDIFERNVNSELTNLTEKLDKIQNGDVDVMAVIRRSLSNIVSIALSGEAILEGDPDEDMFWDIVETNSYFLENARNAVLSFLPVLRFLPGPYSRQWRCLNAIKETILQRYLHAQKTSRVPGKPRGISDMLFDAQDEEKADGDVVLTDKRVICSILELVITGMTTTWSLLSSAIFLLIHHPEFQDRLAKELQSVAKQGEEVTGHDKFKSPLFEALELETLRILPVTQTFLPRLTSEDVQYQGYTIRKDTMIIANMWKVHHDENIWGDPWTFRPERFLDGNGALLPREHVYRTSWMPFGVGKRSCPGEPFARARYFLYVATLLRNWKFRPHETLPGGFDPMSMDNFDIDFMVKPKPYLCRIEKREWD